MTDQSSHPIHAGPNDSWHGIIAPNSQFPPAPNRYHLYIGLFCPFAHRANLVRHLQSLESIIDISIVRPYPKGDDKGWPGWCFNVAEGAEGSEKNYPGATVDRLFGSKYLHEVYFKADPEYKGRYSVPLLWDTETATIVCNESAELLRWLGPAFEGLSSISSSSDSSSSSLPFDFYPPPLRPQIDALSPWIQRDLNSGVYRAGFAPDQATYDKNLPAVFAALNQLEKTLHTNGGPYILGNQITELDLLAYPTVIRFDTIYVAHFKTNLGTIRGNYPVVHEWLKNLYWNQSMGGFRDSTDFRHIKDNYTKSHKDINPLGITPMGPYPDIEDGINLDFAAIKPGVMRHPLVLEKQKELYGDE